MIYLDANSIIYSVGRIVPYHALLLPVWQAASTGVNALVTSSLSLLESLVGPLKARDSQLEADYRRLLLQASDIRLAAITDTILERAAALRVTTTLKTPDAIHAATALVEDCALFISNDAAFRTVPGLTVVMLQDMVTP